MSARRRHSPEELRGKLRTLLENKQLVRAIEVHDGISALVANNVKLELGNGGENNFLEFDALWGSGFTDSTSKGLPDIELVSPDSRLSTIERIMNVTDKPLIVDGDTGGEIANFEYFLNRLELLGVSAVVIEDKTYPKRNSLDDGSIQNLEAPEVFANKIRLGKEALLSKDFMIFARIESLIAGFDVEDALLRAEKYLQAGADGILIHSRETDPVRVLKFAKEYSKLLEKIGFYRPLICVPTTYNTIKEEELCEHGFKIVIYANHLLRASVKSMQAVCKNILLKGRAFESEPYCTPITTIMHMVGFEKIKERDLQLLLDKSKAKVIIPAAGKPKETIIECMPSAMLDVNGKTVMQRQLDVLRHCGIADVTVVRGYAKEKFSYNGVKYYDAPDYTTGSLHSLFSAQAEMDHGFFLIFSDILFDESIIVSLLKSTADIVLIADASYPYHRHEIDKELDLLIGKQEGGYYRQPSIALEKEVTYIGKKIKKDIATHEFIGIAKFSEYGAKNLKELYSDCLKNHSGRFHESESFGKASIVDMIQEMIDRGFTVNYIETNKGWMEIHNKKDYEMAKKVVY
ncbi:MAG: phosphoenolpyruvate mutase [Candidatus Bathyarchaeota archaeon]|nr:phosphoenolpyruvate mutase [Candidatus Bathyarchaeum sp.]